MTREEFESRTTRTCTAEEYKDIEKVYTFHPCIDAVNGKDQIANLFDTFGMRIIYDMLPTAEKAEELEFKIRRAKHELDILNEAMDRLKSGR